MPALGMGLAQGPSVALGTGLAQGPSVVTMHRSPRASVLHVQMGVRMWDGFLRRLSGNPPLTAFDHKGNPLAHITAAQVV